MFQTLIIILIFTLLKVEELVNYSMIIKCLVNIYTVGYQQSKYLQNTSYVC